MNVSEPFILRPVATTLLMVAIMLSGTHRVHLPAAVHAAGSRLPDDPGDDPLSGRQSGSDDVFDHVTAGAAIRANARTESDDVGQLRRRVGDHAAVQPRSEPRRGRAAGPGRDQCRRKPAAERPAGSADLRQGQPGRCAYSDSLGHLQHVVADRSGGHERNPPGAENLAIERRRTGLHQRRPKAGSAHSAERPIARRLWPQHRRCPHHDRQRQRQHAKRQFRRTGASFDDQRQRSAHQRRPNTPT